MTSRPWLLLSSLGLTLAACDPSSSREPSVTLALTAALDSDDTAICFAVRVFDSSGELVFERGRPETKPATLEEALSSGAACGTPDAEVDARCALGPSEARAWIVGLYTDGQRIDGVLTAPCGGLGCAKSFECREADNPAVDFELTLMRESRQGFFDVSVMSDGAPDGATGICYAVRLRNEDGTMVVSSPSICSDAYGNGLGGDITYVLPCDAESPRHDITLWVHPPEGSRVHFETPCPVPTTGDIETWEGGCTLSETCIENHDTTVQFDFETQAP